MAQRTITGRILLSMLVLFGVADFAMAYEEPEYQVIDTFEEFELRRYEPYLVAETTIDGDFGDSGNRAFKILAGYIFGDNRASEKMKMTVPVTRTTAGGETMNMTAPVTRQSTDDGGSATTYQFVMERKYTMETLPEPVDARVSLREIPARFVAARRYTGRINERNFDENADTLLAELAASGIRPLGKPQSAVYNGPFTLPFFRRNEVLVDVDPESLAATPAK